ncbi:alpha/beta hydrolase [Auraticoccus cholistanensis]|uniref:alpha/beta hydrolase n=1 Tax=Auraticoccus cholistanensis TaxID=2656650 RepID=UPI0018D26227
MAAAGVVGALCATGLAVPAQAKPPVHSEPVVQDLVPAALRTQQLLWEDCEFPDVAEPTRSTLLAVEGLQCATVVVPRDWYHAKDGNTIEVEISKVPAADESRRRGVMLINPGGPGGSGLPWSASMALRSPDVHEVYDTIGFDPRGVGESTELICEYDASAQTQVEFARNYAEGCLRNPLTPFITTRQTTLDMDFIRYLLGEKKLSYVGYSYGTWLGGSYAATFPSKTDRFLLDSATDMTSGTLEETWDLQPGTRDRQMQDMLMPYIARHDDVYGMGDTAMEARRAFEEAGGFDNYINIIIGLNTVINAMYSTELYPQAAAVLSALAEVNAGGVREDFRLPYGTDAVRAVPDYLGQIEEHVKGLDISAEDKAAVLAELDDALQQYVTNADAADGQIDGQIEGQIIDGQILDGQILDGQIMDGQITEGQISEGQITEGQIAEAQLATDAGAFEAIRCQDGQWTTDLETWEAKLEQGFRDAPLTAMFQSVPVCAFWPAQEEGFPELKNKDLPGVLFLQSEFDAATAYEGAERSIRKFTRSKAVVVDNEGSHGLFPYGTECVDQPALTWLLDGELPRSKWNACVGVPLPGEIYTYNVGGTVNKNGKLRGFKMQSESVQEANEMVAELRREAGIPDIPGSEDATVAAALPVR